MSINRDQVLFVGVEAIGKSPTVGPYPVKTCNSQAPIIMIRLDFQPNCCSVMLPKIIIINKCTLSNMHGQVCFCLVGCFFRGNGGLQLQFVEHFW